MKVDGGGSKGQVGGAGTREELVKTSGRSSLAGIYGRSWLGQVGGAGTWQEMVWISRRRHYNCKKFVELELVLKKISNAENKNEKPKRIGCFATFFM